MRGNIKARYGSIVALFVLLFLPSTMIACSCIENSTVDVEFARWENVALFKVEHIEIWKDGEKSGSDSVKWARLKVERVYKGNLKIGQEIVFPSGNGAACLWPFHKEDLGEEFLFYLGPEPILVTICSRSGSRQWAAADLSFLENYSKVRGRTRISGILSQYLDSAVDGDKIKSEPLAHQSVRIYGNGRSLTTETDENGVYEVYGLSPGVYRIEPEEIKGYAAVHDYSKYGSASVILTNSGQAEKQFQFEIQNSIKGRLIDADGKPLEKRVRLDLIPAHGSPRKYFVEIAYPEKGGVFEFKDVPAGTYVIVGNPENEITAENPYPRFYSSGIDDRHTAEEITVVPGSKLRGLTVKASRPFETVVISGHVLFANNNPVSGEGVKFVPVGKDGSVKDEPWTSTDRNGNFILTVLKRQKGVIFSYLFPDTYKYRSCLDKLEIAKEKAILYKDSFLSSDQFQIESAENLTEVEVKFPFTLCKP